MSTSRFTLIAGLALGLLFTSIASAWPPPPGKSGNGTVCQTISKTFDKAGVQVSQTWNCGNTIVTCHLGANGNVDWQGCDSRTPGPVS